MTLYWFQYETRVQRWMNKFTIENTPLENMRTSMSPTEFLPDSWCDRLVWLCPNSGMWVWTGSGSLGGGMVEILFHYILVCGILVLGLSSSCPPHMQNTFILSLNLPKSEFIPVSTLKSKVSSVLSEIRYVGDLRHNLSLGVNLWNQINYALSKHKGRHKIEPPFQKGDVENQKGVMVSKQVLNLPSPIPLGIKAGE